MKDLIRRKSVVQENILNLLNKQIKLEAQASASYLAMAAWCSQNNFHNSGKFFFEQSDEERAHMMKIFHFVNDMGGNAVSPEVASPRSDFSSLREIFELALENEIAVTESIHQLVSACRKCDDYATENFLQWFVTEQIEEEAVVRNILDYFEMIGEEPMALLMIDERIKKASETAS